MKRKPGKQGTTLIEMLIVIVIFGIILTLAGGIFISGEELYSRGNMEVGVQSSGQEALSRMVADVQESDLNGIRIDNATGAVLLISARTASGAFVFYAGASTAYAGGPYWEKWVSYYLTPEPGTAYQMLVRKAGNPASMPSLPVNPPVIPALPAGWENLLKTSTLPLQVVAGEVQTFKVQDINCATTGNPLYLQVISSQTYAGKVTRYNPGNPVSFSCGGQSGNWVEMKVQN